MELDGDTYVVLVIPHPLLSKLSVVLSPISSKTGIKLPNILFNKILVS